jgi:hypothetical protein
VYTRDFDPLLATYESLPPGLWPPRAEEPTDQFLKENFNHDDHTDAELITYGAFVVGLALLGPPRESMMPKREDFADMYEAGYGLSVNRLTTTYGGTRRLQRLMGFSVKGDVPEQPELIDRLRWMARYSLQPFRGENFPPKSAEAVMHWGQSKDLLPSTPVIEDVLGGRARTHALFVRLFSIEKPRVRELYTFLDVYKFGATVIRENDGPLTRSEMNEKYHDYFRLNPYSVILSFFGSLHAFWLEFDHVADASGLTPQDVIHLGIRRAIADDDPCFTRKRVAELSRAKRFPNKPVQNLGGVMAYTELVEPGYQAYQKVRDRLVGCGVNESLVKSICQRKFEPTPEFEAWLCARIGLLRTLSLSTSYAQFLRELVQDGFDLDREAAYKLQQIGLPTALENLGIEGSQKRQLYELIPRIDPNEALASEGIYQ